MIRCLRSSNEGVFLDLYVQPRASRTEIVGFQGDELKIRLTSPPVEGAANRLCTEFFAKLIGLPKSDVVLVGGDKSRHKRLLLRGMSLERVSEALAAALGDQA